jgi:type IV pilus assembly protein PilX
MAQARPTLITRGLAARLHPLGSAARRTRQRGMTMLVILILLSVMLLGALGLARVTEGSTLVSGNVASKEASLQAAEIGWNAAYAKVKALADDSADTGGWYWATMQPTDGTTGLPTTIDFDATPELPGGVERYTVTYAVDRLCTQAVVTANGRECLVKQANVMESRDADAPDYQPKSARQYRITVRVTDARGTQTWTQSLVTKGG